jgi:hypothetical protein
MSEEKMLLATFAMAINQMHLRPKPIASGPPPNRLKMISKDERALRTKRKKIANKSRKANRKR